MGEEGVKQGVMEVHGNEYHDPDFEQEGVAAALVGTHEAKTTGIHGVGASTVESAAGSQSKVNTHEAKTTGVHGVGASTVESTAGAQSKVDILSAAILAGIATRVTDLITPIAGEILRQSPTENSPFYAQIHDFPPGTLSSTVVPYRDPTNEGCLTGISAGAGYWGRIILRNTTIGGSRKIVSVDTANNLITTEPSVDSWADNDYINTHSEMVWENFFDVDLSAHIGTDVKAIALFGVHSDISGVNNASRTVFYHPRVTYDDGLRLWIPCRLANDSNSLYLIMPVYDQRISMKYVALTNGITITAAKGVLK
jgi:hypothetical protein